MPRRHRHIRHVSGTQYPGVSSFVTTTINVDGTNTNDEFANICSVIAGTAGGSGSTYRRFLLNGVGGTIVRMSAALQISPKDRFILDLGGCTLKTDVGAAFTQLTGGIVLGHAYLGFWDGGVTNFIITNGTLWQNNPAPGVYSGARESQANLEIAGGGVATPCHDGLIYNMTFRGAGGDTVKFGGSGDIVYNIRGYNNVSLDTGRMGISVIYGHDIYWNDNTQGPCGYNCWDIEPNIAANPSDRIYIRRNTYSTWGIGQFGSINGSSTASPFSEIYIEDNLITGKHMQMTNNNGASRTAGLYIRRNRSLVAAAGPIILCSFIDTLRVQENTQPLLSGVLGTYTNNTDAITAPNYA